MIKTFEEFSKNKLIPCKHCLHQVAIGYDNAREIGNREIKRLEQEKKLLLKRLNQYEPEKFEVVSDLVNNILKG